MRYLLHTRLVNVARRLAHASSDSGWVRNRLAAALLLSLALGSGVARISIAHAEEPAPEKTKPATDPTAEPHKVSFGRKEQRELRRKWVRLIRERKFAELAESFAPALKGQLSPEKFAALIGNLEQQVGQLSLERDRWYTQRFGLTQFEILRLKAERAEIDLRLVIDTATGGITDLWLAPVKVNDRPPGFDDSQYCFGEAARLAAEARLSVVAKILDADGQQTTANVWFYRALGPNEAAEDGDWHDPRTAKTWRRIDGDDTSCTFLPVGSYRAVAAERHRNGHTNYVPFGLSELVTLDGSQEKVETTVQLQRGSSLVVHSVEAATGQALSDIDLGLKCADQTLPPSWQARPIRNERQPGVATFDALPAAKYELLVDGRARSPDDVERTPVESPILIEIQPELNREVTIKLRTARLDDQQIAKRWPWVATGRVTDPAGRPIAGATVRAATGYGTLLGGGSTTTDADGRYRLHFGQGIWSDNPVNLQVAVLSASKPGYFETNLNRQGGLAMARSQPSDDDLRHWGGQKVVFLPGEPRELNFELARAATIRVELVDAAGEDLAEASVSLSDQAKEWNGVAAGETSRGGDYTFENVPVGRASWIAATVDKKLSARSLPFTLPRAENYRMKLQFRRDEANDLNLLEVQSITSAAGEEIKDAVLGDDPFARPPVTDADQAAARDILKKLLDANSPWWFARPPAEIASIRYDFCFASGDRRNYAFEQDQEKFDHWVAHGLSYSSAAAMLCANRNAVAFRLVEIQPNVIRLAYTTNARWRYSVGNGVQGTWRGFQSGGVREGILSIDPRRWVPLEHKFGDMREVFSDFVKLPSGKWAPRSVQILAGDRPKFDWKFDLYEPGVWLFSSSRDTRNPDAPPIARLENVVINGEPGKRQN